MIYIEAMRAASAKASAMRPAHRDHALEQILDDNCLSWKLVQVNLDRVDWKATTASQIRGDGADPDVVERYTAALARGELFPAGFGIDHGDDGVRIVGGIHRAEAHKAAARDTIPLYLLADHSPDTSILLAAISHNASHGVPLGNADRARHALELIDNRGLTRAEAAAIVGLSGSKVSQAVTARDGLRRANRLGPSCAAVWRSFGATIQYRLAAAARGHTNTVFAELVDTAAQCDIDTAKASTIAAGLTAAGTEHEALQFLADFEAGHHPTASRGQSRAAKVRTAAMTICDLNPDRFADSITPSFVDPTIALLERTARRLAECAIALQKKAAEQ